MHTPTYLPWLKKVFFIFLLLSQAYSISAQNKAADSQQKKEALACYNMASAAYYANPELAAAYYEEIYPVFEDENMWYYYCYTLIGLSSVENRLYNFDKAERIAKLAIEKADAHIGKNNEQYVLAMNNYASLLQRKGRREEAISAWDKAVELNQSFLKPNYMFSSLMFQQLGGAYLELGDLPQAIKFYEKSLQIWNEQNHPAYRHIVALPFSIGKAYRELKQWEKAKRTYLDYIPFSDSLSYIRLCYGLGATYIGMNMNDSARFYIERGKEYSIKGQKPFIHTSEELLGSISQKEGDIANAIQHYKKFHSIRLTRPKDEYSHQTLIDIYGRTGELLSQQGQLKESLEQFQLAISYLKNKDIDSTDWKYTPKVSDIIIPWDAIEILTGKAKSLLALNKQSKDESMLMIAHESVKLGAELVSKTQQLHESEGGKIYLSKAARPLVEIGIEVCQELFKLTGKVDYAWDALKFAEEIKSRLLVEELIETEAIFQSNLPTEIQTKIQGMEADIGFYKKNIDQLEITSSKDSLTLVNFKNILFELETNQTSFEKQLEEKYPLYKKRKAEFPKLNREVLQSYLNQKERLIEFFWGTKNIYIFSTSHKDIKFTSIPIQNELISLIENIARNLRQPDMSQETYRSFCNSSFTLYETILADHLTSAEINSLYIIPDGPLSYLPFETLLTAESIDKSRTTPSQAYRQLSYLFHTHKIQYLHTAGLIKWESDNQANQHSLAAFAPDYRGLLKLKNNRVSAQKIGKILEGKTFLDSSASERNFKDHANTYESLHLAVHGNVDVNKPINAYLDFGNSDSLGEDNRLYAYELYALALNAKLVSLIACEAGYGKLEKGEGVMSLARAFRMAGANSIMTSLWKADGRAASPIAEKFYEQLKEGKRPSEALQFSKKEFLQTASPDLTHPYFWATYVLTGNNEAIWPNYLKMYGGWISLAVFLLLAGLLYRRLSKKIKLS